MKELSFRVKNWDQFQHFKDRCPPWIKVYRDILDDPDWHDLSGEEAKVLVMIWLVASEDCNKEGRLPDIRRLSFRLRIPEVELIAYLQKLNHWLICDDITMISSRYQDDAPETETETETEIEIDAPEISSDTTKKTASDSQPVGREFEVANYLADEILKRDPKYLHLTNGKRTKTVIQWASDIEKLHRLDRREWTEIQNVVEWCLNDSFWCKNILSGKKLREKFSDLVLKMSPSYNKPKDQSLVSGGTGKVLL